MLHFVLRGLRSIDKEVALIVVAAESVFCEVDVGVSRGVARRIEQDGTGAGRVHRLEIEDAACDLNAASETVIATKSDGSVAPR